MAVTFHSVVLFVKDIETSKKFYTELLGLEVEYDFGRNIIFKSGLSIWQMPENHIIVSGSSKTTCEKTENSKEVCFETSDINHDLKKLEENDVPFLHGITEESWGQKTIRFYDPDNHLIEIGESFETFIKRMYDSGMTIHAIHKKSSVPEKVIQTIIATH
jgi:catechol 2,3-dioxygenase-like lactoylglutathione lyase family enzyme